MCMDVIRAIFDMTVGGGSASRRHFIRIRWLIFYLKWSKRGLKCRVPSIWNIEIAFVDVVLSFRSLNEIFSSRDSYFRFSSAFTFKANVRGEMFRENCRKEIFFLRSTFTVTRGNEYLSSNRIVERTLFSRSIIHVKLK